MVNIINTGKEGVEGIGYDQCAGGYKIICSSMLGSNYSDYGDVSLHYLPEGIIYASFYPELKIEPRMVHIISQGDKETLIARAPAIALKTKLVEITNISTIINSLRNREYNIIKMKNKG